jgi:hypothetical protein
MLPTRNVGEDAEEKGTLSYTAVGNVSYNHFGKQYGGSLKSKNRSAI